MEDTLKFLGHDRDPNRQQFLNECSSKLNLLAKIGVRILEKEMDSATGEHVIPGLLFIRNQVEVVEAISVLIKDSLIDPCYPLLRVSLETLMQLDYLLGGEKRGAAFLVWDRQRDISTYKRMDGTSEEYKQLKAKFAKDRFLKDVPVPIVSGTKEAVDRSEKFLKKEEYKSINEEFLKIRNEKARPKYWYALYSGPPNVIELAKHCKLDAVYDIIYRECSNYVHGTNIMDGKISRDEAGYLQIHQIRKSEKAKQVTLLSINFVGESFETYIDKRLPSLKGELKSWYLELEEFRNLLSNSK